MKVFGLITCLLLTSCLTASNNSGREDNNSNPPKTPAASPDETILNSNEVLKSQAFRIKGSIIRTIKKEINAQINQTENTNYITIPDKDRDNDASVTLAPQPSNNCGNSNVEATMTERLNHCQEKNPQSYFWDGTKNGINGEGDWRLFYKAGSSVIWLDQTTGLLWSYDKSKTNWDNASGGTSDEVQRVCTLSSFKELVGETVKWRLPTRNEYLQADINGARFVLNSNESIKYWTATASLNKGKAWAIEQRSGVLIELDQNEELEVKCIGTPVK